MNVQYFSAAREQRFSTRKLSMGSFRPRFTNIRKRYEMVRDMDLFYSVLDHLKLDVDLELDVRFGLSMRCIWAMVISACYGVFYLSAGLYELFYFMGFMLLCSSMMLIYSRKGGKHERVIICTGIGILYAFLHLLGTYYLGNSGTVFFVISAMLIPHLYPMLRLWYTLLLDVLLLAMINLTFLISLNSTPIYADLVESPYRIILSNIGLVICLLELYVNIFSINTLKKVKQRLVDSDSNAAYLDALTGLGNRRMLSRYQTSLEADTDTPICLALIDIDFFKNINDSYGHAIGDKALVFIADTMRGFFRKSDLLIRWGGEEFLVLFRYTEPGNAEILMERFRLKVQDTPFYINGSHINISVTVGLTKHRPGNSINDTIATADDLLYQGKSHGRNRIVTRTIA